MTRARRILRADVDSRMQELHVEFDGQQVTVRTDVAEMRDYLMRTYQPMLVENASEKVGEIEFCRSDAGYVFRGATELEFAGNVTPFYDFIRQQLLEQFIRERKDLLWLHAAAVERNGAALLIAGPSGQGKSTLSTLLCENGWNFMSDDTAPVRMESDHVLAFTLLPYRRIHPGRHVKRGALSTLEKELVTIPENAIRRHPAPVSAIVFPVYRSRGRPRLTRLPSGTAAFELLRSYTNFIDHRESGVVRAAELARGVPAYELRYGRSDEAAGLLSDSL